MYIYIYYIYIYIIYKFHIKLAIESSPSTHLSSKPQPSGGRAHGVVGGQAICVVGQHGLAMRPLAAVESNGIKISLLGCTSYGSDLISIYIYITYLYI